MNDISLFKGIEENDIEKLLKSLDARKINYKKNRTIVTNIINVKMIGIILSGTAIMERYDYNGNRSIIEKLEKNSLFGELFSRLGSDISVIATSNCEVLLIEYNNILKNSKNIILINNMFNILSEKILKLNMREEILSKRTIRDKLLTYFSILANDKPNRVFVLPFTYTDLADYLSIDRSAMMREIKYLQDDLLIEKNGKKIKIMY